VRLQHGTENVRKKEDLRAVWKTEYTENRETGLVWTPVDGRKRYYVKIKAQTETMHKMKRCCREGRLDGGQKYVS